MAGNLDFLLRIEIWNIFFGEVKNLPVSSDIIPPLADPPAERLSTLQSTCRAPSWFYERYVTQLE